MASIGPPARRTLTSLWKQGWNEIPEVMASSLLGGVGIVLAITGAINYYNRDGDNKRYKETYIVMRPDDPRAAKIHKD